MSLRDDERTWRALLLAREPEQFAGPERDRQLVYRRLVRNTLFGAIRRATPHARRLVGDDGFDALVALFLEQAPPTTRRLHEVPAAFARWLDESAAAPSRACAELVHWEVLEVEVLLAPDRVAFPSSSRTSSFAQPAARASLDPSTRLCVYAHPVHRVDARTTTWPAASAQPSILVAWRVDEQLRWEAVDGATARALLALADDATVAQACAVVGAEARAAGVSHDDDALCARLDQLCAAGAIAAFVDDASR